LTRYRKKLVEQRTSELQRLAKVLEDSGIKIDSVASKLTTLSARDMIEALIAGERDPAVLADLARGVMRKKIPELKLACAGRFGTQHALMCTLHLEHIDHLTDMIARLNTRIDEASLPFVRQTSLLATVPGIGERAAQVIISEIGVQMSRFPTAAHLASWAGVCPGNNESAGKHRSGKTRKGNTELCEILTECAWAAGRTSTYVGAQFRRFHRRFGKKGGQKAAIATAHTLIVIIWHVLAHGTAYRDLARTTSPGASTTPRPAHADSSTNSKPSVTRSPSSPTPRSWSPAPITDQPGTQPGHRPLHPERAWSP
jgi:transposase